MGLSRRIILRVAFPLVLALLALNIIVAFMSIRTIGRSVRQSTRSRTIQSAAGVLLSTIRKAEAGQRGYLLTGQEIYLVPYREADRLLTTQLEQLESLTSNAPIQYARTMALKSLIRRKREELAHTILLQQERKGNEAIKEVRSGLGRRLMHRLQQVANNMAEHEQRSLSQNQRVSQAAFRKTVRAIVIATALALAFLIVAVISRRRELAERERRTDLIRQNEARLATTFLSIGDAVISTDETGCVQLMNPIAEALTGYSLKESAGRPITEILPLVNETTRKPVENPAARVIAEGVVMGLANHTLLIARDGTEIPIDDSAAPIKGAEGQVIGVIIVFRDITGRRRDEAERERLLVAERLALADAENANRAKDQFLAVLSHELRTPLNPIMLAVTSLLARPCSPEEIGPTLEMIRENVAREARLIDDLLDVMRIARGKLSLHPTLVDCHRLIRHALQICQSDLQGKELRVVLNLAAREHHVTADATRLEQVFWNLIKNAVKFSPRGAAITIRSWSEPDSSQAGSQLIIEFVDQGIGIEPAALPWIFDPFHQGEGSITRTYGGMGLGLAISQGAVEAHGGKLTAESPGRNQGATFRVQLKAEAEPVRFGELSLMHDSVARTNTSESPQAQSQPQPALRILLIEDEPTTLLVLARLLRRLGHEVTTAGSATEALRVAEGAEFDVAISDIALPDGSGLDLLRQLSRDRVLPAIALTGFGMQDDIRRSRAAGFTAHLTKPIDFARLVATIRQVTGHHVGSEQV